MRSRPHLALVCALTLSSFACHPPPAPRDNAPDAAGSAEITAQPPVPVPAADVVAAPLPSASAPAAAVSSAPVTTGKPGLCFVEITGLLSADVFRGVRRSPAREASRARLSAETRGRWDGRDHALAYVQCRYAVRLNGKAFTFEHVAAQGFGSRGDLDAHMCGAPSEKDKAAKQIAETTKQCADPHAGAYGGFDLVEAGP